MDQVHGPARGLIILAKTINCHLRTAHATNDVGMSARKPVGQSTYYLMISPWSSGTYAILSPDLS